MNENTEILDVDIKASRKLKKPIKVFLILFNTLLLLIFIGLLYFNYLLSPVSNTSKIEKYKVASGSSVYAVGNDLEKNGIIRSLFAYKVYVRLNNINEFKAGTYILDKSYSTKEIVSILKGDSYKQNGNKITFKEGWTIRRIAKEISRSTNVTEGEFYAALNDEAYINELVEQYWFLTNDIKNKDIYYPLEGYLYPETYIFDDDADAKKIIKTMLDETNTIFTKYKSQFDSSKYSINELVALASVVEKEGIYENDRKGIASVFYNRLNKNMPLGSDVTTYYANKVEMGSRSLTTKEFNTYNAYNTRGPNMNGKLPVGAISNFSESSLNAVLNPIKSDYYYFVADKSGKTHFTKTYEEHKKVIKELKAANNWID